VLLTLIVFVLSAAQMRLFRPNGEDL
jgi:hypothetical protein